MMNVTLLVKSLKSGQFEASLLGLPACRVEAESRELAIDGLRNTLLKQFQDAEVVSLQLPIAASPAPVDNPWKNLFGVFQDDIYFREVVDIIQAERESLGNEDIDPAYYTTQEA